MNRRSYGSGWASKRHLINPHPKPNIPRRLLGGPFSADCLRIIEAPRRELFAARALLYGQAWVTLFEMAGSIAMEIHDPEMSPTIA